ISMYYDPMIAKLITWGKDRKECLSLLATALDEYIIRGVVHNVGFGRSILRNEAFATGNYSTAFIPTYYPAGFKGDPLSTEDHHQVALSAFFLRNLHKHYDLFQGQGMHNPLKTMFITIKGEPDTDYKIVNTSGNKYDVTCVQTGE